MSSYRKNHYIPRFYLRNFTDNPEDEKGKIDFFNTKNLSYIGIIKHNTQMQESYFYPKDSGIDPQLSFEFEGKHASIVKNIFNGKEFINEEILEVIFLMFFRTKSKRDDDIVFRKFCIDEHLLKYIEPIKNHIRKSSPSLLDDFTDEEIRKHLKYVAYNDYLDRQDEATRNIDNFKKIISEFIGLTTAVIKNQTTVKLISSDNPVILFNPFLKKRIKNAGINGVSQMGAILVLPINPDYLLIAFDKNIYDDSVILNKGMTDSDVSNLNKLQVVSSREGVFTKKFSSSMLLEIQENAKHKVKQKIVNIKLTEDTFFSYIDDGLPQLEFSFIKEKEEVNSIKLKVPFARDGCI